MHRKPPPNYFSRKEQYRLFVLCATLMLVLAMMNEARKPETWHWLWAHDAFPPSEESIDTKISDDALELPADGFQLIASPSDPLRDDLNTTRISKQLLATIQDNTILRVSENAAWTTILQILRDTSQGELVAGSQGFVSFAQLFRQSDIYRGQLVSIRGSIRRAEAIEPRQKTELNPPLFRWIVEPAGPSNAPIVVYSLEKPDRFELGDGIREEAEFTGIFFKRWAYAAGDGTRIAPLVLAKTATWHPQPLAPPMQLPSLKTIGIVLSSTLLFGVVVATLIYRSTVTRRPELERLRARRAVQIEYVDEDQVLPSVEENLHRISESRSDTA